MVGGFDLALSHDFRPRRALDPSVSVRFARKTTPPQIENKNVSPSSRVAKPILKKMRELVDKLNTFVDVQSPLGRFLLETMLFQNTIDFIFKMMF